MDKSKKSADLTKGPSQAKTPQLSDGDLDKVTGGFIGSYIKVPSTPSDIQGESSRGGHDDEIEIHSVG